MSIVEPGAGQGRLIARVKGMLTKPGQTWEEVDTEAATVGGLYAGYVAPLAAIPAVASLIGSLIGGVSLFGVVSYRPSVGWAVSSAVVGFVLSLGWVYVLALVVDNLAPRFEGQKNFIQAFKLAAYSATAAWVAGLFNLLPSLGALVGLAGAIYSLYALYLGLPKLMKAPPARGTAYFVVVLVISVVLGLVGAAILGQVQTLALRPLFADAGRTEIVLPGARATVDLDDIEKTTEEISAAADAIKDGRGGASDPATLKGLLPDSIAGYRRAETTAQSSGVGGVAGSSAEGVYRKGDGRIALSIVDLGDAGKIAGLADALNLNSSQETDTSYQKVGKVDGRFTEESYDRSSRRGEYTVIVGKRFTVKAEGEQVSAEDIKAAAQAVSFARLEQLAKTE